MSKQTKKVIPNNKDNKKNTHTTTTNTNTNIKAKEAPTSSYLQQFKHKQEISKSNIENSDGSILVKGGINFDDLEDWNELDNKDKSNNYSNPKPKIKNIQSQMHNIPNFPNPEIKVVTKSNQAITNTNGNINSNGQMQPLQPTLPYRPQSNVRVNVHIEDVPKEVIPDNFSVNTSHFTNRLELNNNIDKIDISHNEQFNANFDKNNKLFTSTSDHPLVGSTKNIKGEKMQFPVKEIIPEEEITDHHNYNEHSNNTNMYEKSEQYKHDKEYSRSDEDDSRPHYGDDYDFNKNKNVGDNVGMNVGMNVNKPNNNQYTNQFTNQQHNENYDSLEVNNNKQLKIENTNKVNNNNNNPSSNPNNFQNNNINIHNINPNVINIKTQPEKLIDHVNYNNYNNNINNNINNMHHINTNTKSDIVTGVKPYEDNHKKLYDLKQEEKKNEEPEENEEEEDEEYDNPQYPDDSRFEKSGFSLNIQNDSFNNHKRIDEDIRKEAKVNMNKKSEKEKLKENKDSVTKDMKDVKDMKDGEKKEKVIGNHEKRQNYQPTNNVNANYNSMNNNQANLINVNSNNGYYNTNMNPNNPNMIPNMNPNMNAYGINNYPQQNFQYNTMNMNPLIPMNNMNPHMNPQMNYIQPVPPHYSNSSTQMQNIGQKIINSNSFGMHQPRQLNNNSNNYQKNFDAMAHVLNTPNIPNQNNNYNNYNSNNIPNNIQNSNQNNNQHNSSKKRPNSVNKTRKNTNNSNSNINNSHTNYTNPNNLHNQQNNYYNPVINNTGNNGVIDITQTNFINHLNMHNRDSGNNFNPIREDDSFFNDNNYGNNRKSNTIKRSKSNTKYMDGQGGQPNYEEKPNYHVNTVQEYKKKFGGDKKEVLGGLGANIGTKEWEAQQKKIQKQKEYSKNVLKMKKPVPININNVESKTNTNLNMKSSNMNNLITEEDKKDSNKYNSNNNNNLDDSLDIMDKKLDNEIGAKKRDSYINPMAILNKNKNDDYNDMDKGKGKGLGPAWELSSTPKGKSTGNIGAAGKSAKDLKELLNVEIFEESFSKTPTNSSNSKGYSHIQNVRNIKKQKIEEENIKLTAKIVNKKSNNEDNPKINSVKVTKSKIIDSSNNKAQTQKNITLLKTTKDQKVVESKLADKGERPKSSTKQKTFKNTGNNSNFGINANISKGNNTKIVSENTNNYELESLLQNHHLYQEKLEKIRNFVNK